MLMNGEKRCGLFETWRYALSFQISACTRTVAFIVVFNRLYFSYELMLLWHLLTLKKFPVLQLTRLLILEDLRVVKTLCEPCFPPSWNIVEKYVEWYHSCLSEHVSKFFFCDGL